MAKVVLYCFAADPAIGLAFRALVYLDDVPKGEDIDPEEDKPL